MFTIIRTRRLNTLLADLERHKKALRFASNARAQGGDLPKPDRPKRSSMEDLVLLLMADGKPRNEKQISKEIARSGLYGKPVRVKSVGARLSVLKSEGKLSKPAHGIYQLTTTKGD